MEPPSFPMCSVRFLVVSKLIYIKSFGRRAARQDCRGCRSGANFGFDSVISQCRRRVRSVALCRRRRRVDFRYAPFATDGAWRCNMSRRANRRHSPNERGHQLRRPLWRDQSSRSFVWPVLVRQKGPCFRGRAYDGSEGILNATVFNQANNASKSGPFACRKFPSPLPRQISSPVRKYRRALREASATAEQRAIKPPSDRSAVAT